MGMCCFYIEKIGLALSLLKEALKYAEDEEDQITIWYNIGLVATASGHFILAKHSYTMAITISNEKHIQSINNLAIIEYNVRKLDESMNHFSLASQLVKKTDLPMYEPMFNLGVLKEKNSEYDAASAAFKDSLEIFPGNKQAKRMLDSISERLSAT